MKFDVIRPCIVSFNLDYDKATNSIWLTSEDELIETYEVDNERHADAAIHHVYNVRCVDNGGIWDTSMLDSRIEEAVVIYKNIFKD